MARTHADRYLDYNARRIRDGDAPVTVGTYFAYTLRGRAKDWSASYCRTVERACERRDDVIAVRSARGGTAYVRKGDL